jgi:tetratricopeptide (TPR) repeat protein
MIVRDEARNLERCLASARAAVDEVCVVDTGSTDGTPEIAERLGARVARATWNEDFAAARNASLAMARGLWILVLDADEELAKPDVARTQLEAFATRWPGRTGRVWLTNVDGEGGRSSAALTRIFPNDGHHRFRGRIHEQVVRVDGGSEHEPLRAECALEVLHHGYAASEIERRSKLQRNVQLLERALRDEPDDGYLWFQLGRTRALAADHAGALEALERALERCPDDAAWGVQALETGAGSLRALGHSEQALGLLEGVATSVPDRADTQFLLALLQLDTGRLEEAQRGFLRCLELSGAPLSAAESAASASTWAPAHNLGVMHECLGRAAEAERWYRRALELHPGHGPSAEGLARLRGAPASS